MSARSTTRSATRLAIALLGPALLAGAAAAAEEPAALLSPSPAIELAERLRLGIASAGCLLLGWGAILHARRRDARLHRPRDAALIGLSLLTLYAWIHPYRDGFGAWFHYGDAYHYYVGGKYFRELGYGRLYACTVIADVEAGGYASVAGSVIRNLETNDLEAVTAVLADPPRCKSHFTPERWRAFARDVAWFRSGIPIEAWQGLRRDHGYNPPPAWGIFGTLLTNTGPASAAQLLALTSIDPALLAIGFGAIAWAFGWRTACVALIYWGTNQIARWEWVGGSILRFDWLAACVTGICCLRRGRPQRAGLLLAAATALRIFPALIVATLALAALLRMLRERSPRPTPSELRFAVGFASGILIAVALAAWVAGGYRSWLEFGENIRLHAATPSVNLVGLRSALSYAPELRAAVTFDYGLTDPFARWKQGRHDTFARRRLVFALLATAYLGLLAFVFWRRRETPDWLAATLGVAALPVLTELSNYYFAILLVLALLWSVHRDVGAALLLLAATSWWTRIRGGDGDVLFAWQSAAIVVCVVFATLRMATVRAPESSPQRAPGASGSAST